MSFPKYYVTYCVMDTEAGANPFGHSCLIFSQQENEASPVEVMDSVGFYSQPSTTTNPFLKGLKQALGFKVDLQDGHGILRQEAMRHLDGNGLHGISFPVTPEQFAKIRDDYQQMMKTEEEVINELNLELSSQGIEPNGHTRYVAEKAKAATEGRMPRLKPFHFTMKLTMNGLDSSESYTCKDHSLELLTRNQIIPEEIRNQLISNRATTAFPRFSAISLPPIRLISTGKPQPTVSESTGTVYYNREWGTNSLFWGTSIQATEHEALEENPMDPTHGMLTDVMFRIHSMEDLLRHRISEIEEELESNQEHVYQLTVQLNQLKIQLKRVHNLSFLFSNAHENQIPAFFNEKLLRTEQVFDMARMAMNMDKLNYSFLLKAYESILFCDVLLGMLAMALSVAALLVTPPLAAGLFAVSALFTARKLHGFYKEENKFAQTYKEFERQASLDELHDEPQLVPSMDPI
ncbi:hypothetical protein [Legionella maioricensis]|uniref:Uncharacterized protein n=1 Tax=Legionella maioricensis TaxID=2896528 RepID=A0A9X2D3C9_9GAMM|nr:hypothetical protein [Legionella maioricensis]MCL9684882.1 hypothetical protein [Legionella maioricensis]MCL9688958.1 hypothetical protein [Legionella maioricensis]